jgi:hypothetical protein
VEARQRVELTGTNRPRAWLKLMLVLALEYSDGAHRGDSLTTDFGDHTGRVTPVPIPNTEVKTARADGTWG